MKTNCSLCKWYSVMGCTMVDNKMSRLMEFWRLHRIIKEGKK